MDAVITQDPASLGGTECWGTSPPHWGAWSTWNILSSHCSPCGKSGSCQTLSQIALTHQKGRKLRGGNNFLPLYWISWTYKGVWQAGRSFSWEQKGARSLSSLWAINLPMAPPLSGAVSAQHLQQQQLCRQGINWEGGERRGANVFSSDCNRKLSDWRQDYLKDSLYSLRYEAITS